MIDGSQRLILSAHAICHVVTVSESRLLIQFNQHRCRGWCLDPGGGGVLGLEKGTDCGTAVAVTTQDGQKEGAVLLLYCIIGGLSEYLHPIFHIK